jgi:hypothetical protein
MPKGLGAQVVSAVTKVSVMRIICCQFADIGEDR